MDSRSPEEIEKHAPKYPPASLWLRLRWRFGYRGYTRCAYCGGMPKTSRLYVHPVTLARRYMTLCGSRRCHESLDNWQQQATLRRRRSAFDRLHLWVNAAQLREGMPEQYPSISRRVLRAFVDSGMPVATIEERADAATLNGSIRSLGFDREVYAEVRDGQTVLRRVAEVAS